MMDENSIKITDEILKFMLSNKNEFNTYSDIDRIVRLGFKKEIVNSVFHLLAEQGKFITINKRRGAGTFYLLTPLGLSLAEIGTEKYFEQIDKDKQLDRDVKTSSIKSLRLSKFAIGISVVAVISSLTVPFLVVNYEQHINNPEDINATGKQGQSETNQSQSIRLTDSALVEYFKHDTTFLNELKKEISNDKNKTN